MKEKNAENVKSLKIDGVSPKDKDYPFYQTFYYFTKGEPTGAAKQFIDYTRSAKGAAYIKAGGMVPLQ